MLLDLAKKSFPRKARIEPMILRVVTETLMREIHDPRLKEVIITKVTLSNDLSHAKIFIELAEKNELETVVNLLNKPKVQGFFRHHLSKDLPLKRVPKLLFLSDKFNNKIKALHALIDGAMAQIDPE